MVHPYVLSRVLLLLLIQYLGRCDGPLVFGIDETLERRRGKRIRAKGIYRDGVRSSGSHFVKASGLRWISLMWLTAIPWAHRTWALPVLTALAPSERYYQEMGAPSQEAHRLGAPDDKPTASLAAQSPSGIGGGQQLRSPGPAPLLSVHGQTCHLHYQVAPGTPRYMNPPLLASPLRSVVHASRVNACQP